MKTVGQILREEREEMGMTLEVLARKIGATKGYLSMIENHRVAPPSRPLLVALEKYLKIKDHRLMAAADWENTPAAVRKLLTGAPQRGDGARDLDAIVKQLKQKVDLAPQGKGGVQHVGSVKSRIPLINRVAAGYPKDFTDLDYPARVADEYVGCPDVSDGHAFAARVVGDSMLPDYREGDVVIFSPSAKVSNGNDCFVRLEPDHQTTFKRVFFDEGGKIRLQPLNPSFKPQVYAREKVAGLYRAVARYQKI